MDILQSMFDTLRSFLPMSAAIVGFLVIILVARYLLNRHYSGLPGRHLKRQTVVLILSFAGLLVVILTLPVSDTTTGQLLSLIGILLSATIALSAPTFVGNIMAGMMLRAVRSFRPGDFIRVGEYFGRVSEQGLFHVEIQTEDRDLTTMPNLYLVINPVKVIRSSGTIISAEISLGYDVSRKNAEKLLIEAAQTAGLEEPFVYVTKLGDFAVTYTISGLLPKVKHILSTRSTLHKMILDVFNSNGVEIVSPTFMNTRAVPENRKFISSADDRHDKEADRDSQSVPEELVFDKADEAESLEKLREMHKTSGKEIDAVKQQMQETASESEKEKLRAKIKLLKARRERIATILTRKEDGDEAQK